MDAWGQLSDLGACLWPTISFGCPIVVFRCTFFSFVLLKQENGAKANAVCFVPPPTASFDQNASDDF